MTDPIDRATEALSARWHEDAFTTSCTGDARAAFESIDTDDLAGVIDRHQDCRWTAGGWTCGAGAMPRADHVAEAVKAHFLGGDQ